MSATVPTGLNFETLEFALEPAAAEDVALRLGANAQQTASPRREAAATPSAAAPAPAPVGLDALAPIRAAMGR